VKGKGLFLDLDGTLADSLIPLKQVYFSFLDSYGISGNEVEFQQLNGLPFSDIITVLRKAHNLRDDVAKLSDRYSAMVQKAHALAPPAAGARTLLDCARSKGWKVAVVTSAKRTWAAEWLEHNAFAVDAVVGGDDVSAGKPSPEPYQLALSRTHCAPAQSLAVEDSRNGACAALAAGLSTWVIGSRPDWPDGVNVVRNLNELIERL